MPTAPATNNGQVTVINARASYLHCFKAKAFSSGEGEPSFSVSLLLDKKKDAAQIKKIGDEIRRIEADKFKGKKLPADKVCLRDGDTKDAPEYEGMMFLTASNKKRPVVIDRDRTPLTAEDNKPYSGCYVNAVVRLWAQDNQFGKRVNCSLEVIQFVKDGEPFGAPPVDLDSALPEMDDDADDGMG